MVHIVGDISFEGIYNENDDGTTFLMEKCWLDHHDDEFLEEEADKEFLMKKEYCEENISCRRHQMKRIHTMKQSLFSWKRILKTRSIVVSLIMNTTYQEWRRKMTISRGR